MIKTLILLFLLLSSLMAEPGSEHAIGNYERSTCEAAKKKARSTYNIFQMNRGCTCKQTETKKWVCDVSFTYTSKK